MKFKIENDNLFKKPNFQPKNEERQKKFNTKLYEAIVSSEKKPKKNAVVYAKYKINSPI